MGRLTKAFHGIDVNPTEIARYQYDNIGRLMNKKILPNGTFTAGGINDYINRPPLPAPNQIDSAGKAINLLPGMIFIADSVNTYTARIDTTADVGNSISGLQTIDYNHHIKGWLTGINLNSAGNLVPNTSEGDLFSYKLDYEAAGLFDGNIGSQKWHNGQSQRSFSLTYDASSRLLNANYTGIGSENYTMPNLQYDDNGNILKLSRKGLKSGGYGLIDSLFYSYSGNRLTAVADSIPGHFGVDFRDSVSTIDYEYYANGNLKKDKNERIQNIIYNTYLNQPIEIQLVDGRWIKHFYDGGGKLFKTIYSPDTSGSSETWHFIGDKIYKNGLHYQISIPEGRAVYDTAGWHYEFLYQDHLGNSRLAFRNNNGKLEKVSETAFGPFGDVLRGLHQKNILDNRMELQGHEKENTFGLNRIDFGFRTYNPTIGRFDRVDPLADFFPGINSYAYAINNPVLFNDRFGLYPSLANGMNQIAKCETCPDEKEYDLYRDNAAQFTYIDGIVVNGDGSGPEAHASRNRNGNFLYEFGMGSAATTAYYLGRRIDNLAKWEGTYRYGGRSNVLTQVEIDAKAIAKNPLLKTRPINILRQYALPRPQALKLAKGLKFAGNLTALYSVGSASLDSYNGKISASHALTTIGLTGLGIGAATLSAPIAIPAIIIGGLYGIYEEDIWHDYDKQNASNFKEE